MIIKIPTDNEEMTKHYAKNPGEGCCGQAAIAIIEGLTIQEVMNNWESFGLDFKGWSGWKQIKDYLKERGYVVTQKNNLKEYEPCYSYIARVQWLGQGEKKEKPFYGHGHWSKATAHTHFIAILQNKYFFCNETGLSRIKHLSDYLINNQGVITSHMEIIKLKQ